MLNEKPGEEAPGFRMLDAVLRSRALVIGRGG
jgi:hypothetical protein